MKEPIEPFKATCQLFLIFNGVFIVLLLLGLGISELVYQHIKWATVLRITIASEILMLLLSLFGGIQEMMRGDN